ncbi:hypothetical protein [Sulfolobus sp. S-194]|uniref:hypothetical protein n=1 Tax=Sulfolobus sp. S-194 TaxID=2512240 RepID=UPI0025705CEA|nr:hypothetical protein [Sulfolobus sp. S-194]
MRLPESLQELYLSIEMRKESYSRNSTSKLFLSKGILSSIIVSNFNKIVEKKKEGRKYEIKWYLRIGYQHLLLD